MIHPQAKKIRAKKLGILIQDAREAARKSKKECAEVVRITTSTLGAFERGAKSPSLPQLELLAYYLDVPLAHFWGNRAISEAPSEVQQLNIDEILDMRQQTIGGMLGQAREKAGLSMKELAGRAGMTARRVKAYETGQSAIPLPELEALLDSLELSLSEFMDQEGPVSSWANEQESVKEFLELPPELQSFVCKPINRPFLEVAQRLSRMQVDQLRSVAEGLLEITF